LPRLIGAPADAEARLDSLKVAVIGAGSVGRSILLLLAPLQLDTIWVVDPGQFKHASYLTHPHLLPGEAIDQSKARNGGELIKRISPKTNVLVFDGPVESLSMTAFMEADFVFLATDRLAPEVDTGQRCIHLGLPLIQASVEGSAAVAQVRFFGVNGTDGLRPCPACGYVAQEWFGLNHEIQYSCEGYSQDQPVSESQAPPTASLSFICSLAADLALMQMLKSCLGLGPPPDDTMLEYSAYAHKTTISPLKHNAHCPYGHRMLERMTMPQQALADCTLGELVKTAFQGGEASEAAIMVGDDSSFAELAECACGQSTRIDRFVSSKGEELGRCRCGAALHAHPFHVHRPVSASIVEPVMSRRLAELGGGSASWVMIQDGDWAVLFKDEKELT
jgi:hypothetical protein